MFNRRILVSLGVLAATFGASFGTAVPTTYAATCSGSSCNGLDPVNSYCNGDAYDYASQNVYSSSGAYVGVVVRRYSPSCRAYWSVARSSVGATYLEVWMADNKSSTVYSSSGGTTSLYSNMWSTGLACARIASSTTPTRCA